MAHHLRAIVLESDNAPAQFLNQANPVHLSLVLFLLVSLPEWRQRIHYWHLRGYHIREQRRRSAQPPGGAVHAMVPAPLPPQSEEEPVFSAPIPQLPVELDVTIPVREFRVRQLLALAPGQVIETQRSHGDDLPLAAGDVQVAWSEFEVVETRLAVRVTRLA
jgi:flagellar motor switch protein FliN/FliY